jgi:phage-related protein
VLEGDDRLLPLPLADRFDERSAGASCVSRRLLPWQKSNISVLQGVPATPISPAFAPVFPRPFHLLRLLHTLAGSLPHGLLDCPRRGRCGPCPHVKSDIYLMSRDSKPLVWLHGEIRTPPFSAAARKEAGELLRGVQHGEMLGLPHSRPMPSIGPGCHSLRIVDEDKSWRIVYAIRAQAILILRSFRRPRRRRRCTSSSLASAACDGTTRSAEVPDG